MYDRTNPQTPVSYTNKDFQTIYPELLEMAKKLSYIWDPTISNESDPGVVLLKLGAIIGDKNSYNIDKNILENFPETCTQPVAARSQYRQLGYKMPWYRGATVDVNFKWIGEPLENGQYFKIPKYTMVVTGDNSTIYTTTQEVTIGVTATSKLEANVPAIQGTITTFKAAGQEVIRLSSLDDKNRLHINDKFIAENGIFITNYYDDYQLRWTQVQNVELVPPGTKCYEFDVDPLSGVPYIQFPDDVRNLIEDGLYIRYIVTDGYEGNIAAEELSAFYEDVVVSILGYDSSEEKKTLSAESIRIYNAAASDGGADPETPEIAYKHYKKFVGTFDTLVTLRDYMNAIYNSELVSNVVVSDRNSDMQHSYRIVDKEESSLLGYITHHCQYENDKLKRFVIVEDEVDALTAFDNNCLYKFEDNRMEKVESIPEEFSFTGDATYYSECYEDIMDAYDLKLTVLHKSDSVIRSLSEYNKTFEIDNSSVTFNTIKAHVDSLKSVQHDFNPVVKDLPVMLQNVYPIRLKVVPTYKLNSDEMAAVVANIRMKLMNMLNSRNCEFGDEPPYDSIYAAVKEADNRIKVVIMDDFVYTTYAIYLDVYHDEDEGKEVSTFKYVPISDYTSSPNVSVIKKSYTHLIGASESTNQRAYENCVESGEGDIHKLAVEMYNKSKKSIRNNLFILEVLCTKTKRNTNLGSTSLDNIIAYVVEEDSAADGMIKLKKYSDRIIDIRRQVIAKNILAGVTPLLNIDEGYKLPVSSTEIEAISTDKISTELTISPFGSEGVSEGTELIPCKFDPLRKSAEYTLRDNESIKFLAPSFLTKHTYAGYTKFELVSAAPKTMDAKYVVANPDDCEELRVDGGFIGLYAKDASGYHELVTQKFKQISDMPPVIKLDSYCDDNGSSISFLPSKKADISSGDFDAYRIKPVFEHNLYYRRTTKSGLPKYELLTDRPSDWDGMKDFGDGDIRPSYTQYYRLNRYYPGFAPASKVGNKTYDSSATYYTKEIGSATVLSSKPADISEWTEPIYVRTQDYKYFLIDTKPDDWDSSWENYYTVVDIDGEVSRVCLWDSKNECLNKDIFENRRFRESATSAKDLSIDDINWDNWKNYYVVYEIENEAAPVVPLSENKDGKLNFGALYTVYRRSAQRVPTFTLIENFSTITATDIESLYTVDWTYIKVNGNSISNFPDYYILTNLCNYKVDDDNCFSQVPETMYNLYRKVKYQSTDIDVTYTSTLTGTEVDGETTHVTRNYLSDVNASEFDCFEMVTAPESGTDYATASEISDWDIGYGNYEVMRWDNSQLEYSSVTSAGLSNPIPDFYAEAVYLKHHLSSGTYKYIKLTTVPADWTDNYSDYFLSDGEMIGLDESSSQFTSWKSGSLILYKMDSTFYLPANTEYQLRNGDRLTFFYRTEDDDEAPYTYESYTHIADKTTKEPFILKANFNLKANTPSNCIINPTSLNTSTGTIPYSPDENSPFQRIRRFMYDEYDLSGSKQIEIRAMNSKTLTMDNDSKLYKYYFVSRTAEGTNSAKTFTMNLRYVNDVGNKHRYRYLIGQDEYFIYTNEDLTGFEALGAGTMVELYTNVSPEENDGIYTLQVTAVNPNDIYLKGIKVFADKCNSVRPGEEVKLIEQQIYNFTGGDTIFVKLGESFDYSYESVSQYDESATYVKISAEYLSAKRNAGSPVPPFVSNYYYKQENDKVTYTMIEDEPMIAPEFNYSKSYYKAVENQGGSILYEKLRVMPDDWNSNCESYYYDSGYGFENVQRVSNWEYYFENNSIYIRTREVIEEVQITADNFDSEKNSIYKRVEPLYPVFKTGYDCRLNDVSISYKSAGDKTFTELPKIYVNDAEYVWSAEAILNIIASPTNHQKVDVKTRQSLQSIVIKDLVYPVLGGGSLVDNSKPLYIIPSVELDKVGGKNTDVTYTTLNGDIMNILVVAYQIVDSPDSNCSSDGDTVVINIEADSESNTDWTLSSNPDQEYGYILPIAADRGVSVSVSVDRYGELSDVECLEGLSYVTGGHHYFVVKEPDIVLDGSLAVHIAAKNEYNTDTAKVKLLPVVKFRYRNGTAAEPDILDGRYGINSNDILQEIRRLDVPGVFNYIHIPSNDVVIRDPLDPISMFDTNHAFNSVVMPRAGVVLDDTSSTKTNYGSEIVFVNNK